MAVTVGGSSASSSSSVSTSPAPASGFEIVRLIGRGAFGEVHLVRKACADGTRTYERGEVEHYALKSLYYSAA